MSDFAVPASASDHASPVINLDRVRAETLGEKLQGLTAARTQLDHQFLTALAEFDRTQGWTWSHGITSTAHWLSFACSIAPGTAREHVRVARALGHLPETNRLMADGQLTYSKVREITRLLDVDTASIDTTSTDTTSTDPEQTENEASLPFDEVRLCELALEMTASQLARTVRAYRGAAGSRIAAEARRSLTIKEREDDLTEFRVLLPVDEAALVEAALRTAQSAAQSATTSESESTPGVPLVDALLDLARVYLAGDARDPEDDHHLVTVLVDADTLTHPDCTAHDVPAGTCEIPNRGGIEPTTAARLACDCTVQGVIRDSDGVPLHLGRARRTVSRGQRRALVARDRHCQFPGCTHTRWLKAHHIIHWAHGGPTDLPNLMLLCQRHHTAVHDGAIAITGHPGAWRFTLPDGTELTATSHLVTDEQLLHALGDWAHDQAIRPDHDRVFPPGAGHGYSIHECVAALFTIHAAA